MNNDKICTQFYECLEKIGNHFNAQLFNLKLPPTIFTLNSEIKALGHFRHGNWISNNGEIASEIVLNPDLFAFRSWIELLKTVAHQQCHLIRCAEGDQSRSNYHNRSWSKLMLAIGLIPSSTGMPGGDKTGQNMLEYLDPNGQFLQCCIHLVEENIIFPVAGTWPENQEVICDVAIPDTIENSVRKRLLSPVGALQGAMPRKNPDRSKYKIKYSCPSCKDAAWGKPGLRILCANCDAKPYESMTNSIF